MSAFARAAEATPPNTRRVRSKVDVWLEALATVDPESADGARAALRDPRRWSVNGLVTVLDQVAAETGVADPPRCKAVTDWRRANL